MCTENSDKMKAISASRIRAALRGAQINFASTASAINEITDVIMAAGVEIQRPDTVLKSEYDLVVAKNATLVQLMALMTDRLNEKSDSDVTTKT